MNAEIETIKKEIEQYLISTADELESFRLKYLSRNGQIPDLLSKIGALPAAERAEAGKVLNTLKNLAKDKFETAKIELESSSSSRCQSNRRYNSSGAGHSIRFISSDYTGDE